MIQNDATAILIDFGLAGEIIPSSRYEGFKAFAHPIFAPYEQGYGERKPTIDVYTLAASLYYAVTRNPPARGSERFIQVIFNSQSDPLIPPEQYNPDISNNLKLAIEKGMKLEPQFRPQSMVKWLALLPEMDNSKIVNDDYDYEVAIPSRYKRTIKHEFNIVRTLGVIFNYLGQGLKVTFFITIDVLERIINILGDILADVFEVLGDLPWLDLGLVALGYSIIACVFARSYEVIAITVIIALISSLFESILINDKIGMKLLLSYLSGGFVFLILSRSHHWAVILIFVVGFIKGLFITLCAMHPPSQKMKNLFGNFSIFGFLPLISLMGISFGMTISQIFSFPIFANR